MNVPRRKLAIFDIDGTIFRSSLLIELTNALAAEGIFRPSASRAYERARKKWLDRQGEYEDYITSVIVSFRKNLKGVAYDDFLRVAQQVVTVHQNRVYQFTRDLVRNLKQKGYWLAAISHSPKAIVGPFAKRLGFDKTYGILYELDGAHKFTGRAMYEDLIYDKAKIVQRILEKETVTLKGSVGVGDTESDISFLRLVNRPICFNPNRKLYAAAKRADWRIVIERKDLIYRV
ncbi:MAG: HAD family phosphatase [Candidatus Liptonbacteria bacterium]|nr:HAD family phosphatase [Candidatus Liptonbacteria bacterium]